MKSVRANVFETNSSSTHSISIKPEGWYGFKFGQDYDSPTPIVDITEPLGVNYNYKTATITSSNYYKRGDGYYLIEGERAKLHFIGSCMSRYMSSLEIRPKQVDPFNDLFAAVRGYLEEKYDCFNLNIKVDEIYSCGIFMQELIGWGWGEDQRPFTKEEIKTIIYRILSDDSIVFTCFSDEVGPYPEDMGLLEINDLKDLLDENNKEEYFRNQQ